MLENNICFVIQPFDGAGHDKRFEDTLKPSIEECGLHAYRVDQDPSAVILIATIEENIQNSRLCIADISSNNPNVWYELGFAFACKKDLILICKKGENENLPFDIRHRNVIFYSTDSESDFKNLKAQIVGKIKIIMKNKSTNKIVSDNTLENIDRNIISISKNDSTCNLKDIPTDLQHVLSIFHENSDEDHKIYSYPFKNMLQKEYKFSKSEIKFLLQDLFKYNLIEKTVENDNYGEECEFYKLTNSGYLWCDSNRKIVNSLSKYDKKSFDNNYNIPF